MVRQSNRPFSVGACLRPALVSLTRRLPRDPNQAGTGHPRRAGVPAPPARRRLTRAWAGFATLTALASVSAAPARHPSALQFPVMRRDLGAVETGRIASTRFAVRNSGRRLVHLAIEGECGCMTARGPMTLAPGASGEIYVRFQPQALWSGKVEKHVSVTTDERGNPQIELTVLADIIPYIRIEPQNPVVIRYEPGHSYSRDLQLVPRAGRHVTMRQPKNPSGGVVRARLVRGVVLYPPLSSIAQYTLHLEIGPVSGPGDSEETVMVPTTDPQVPMLPVEVDIVAAKGPVVSPRELFAPAVEATDRGAELTKLQVFTRSGQLHLGAIETGNRGLEARVAERSPGRAYEITLRYAGGWRPGGVDTVLKIHTDDPGAPVLSVPFHILVR